jgi:hypothetical protein
MVGRATRIGPAFLFSPWGGSYYRLGGSGGMFCAKAFSETLRSMVGMSCLVFRWSVGLHGSKRKTVGK